MQLLNGLIEIKDLVFSRGQGTEDIFIHMETLRRFGLAELRSGQVVLVRFGKGEKGLMTAEIYPDIGIPLATH